MSSDCRRPVSLIADTVVFAIVTDRVIGMALCAARVEAAVLRPAIEGGSRMGFDVAISTVRSRRTVGRQESSARQPATAASAARRAAFKVSRRSRSSFTASSGSAWRSRWISAMLPEPS